ncbi:hypothetical protein, partial [Nocardioides sp.]|uniref:hypothetical protein n=1 Tax=Nocardioides sp. TaxID=35761 RepID=UPI002ED41AB5
RSGDIQDDSIRSVDIKDGTIRQHDLTEPAQAAFKGKPGKPGKDGKDGVSGIAAGAGYADLGHHAKWEAGSWGQTVQKCKAGEYAVGGGFSSWGGFNGDNSKDLGGAADVQITVSAPYIENDAAYEPISDTDSRFRPTLWVVRGFNHGSEPVDVRAWVVCAADPSAN